MKRLKIGEGLGFAKQAYDENLRPIIEVLEREYFVETGENLPISLALAWSFSMYVEAIEKEKMIRVDPLTNEIVIE